MPKIICFQQIYILLCMCRTLKSLPLLEGVTLFWQNRHLSPIPLLQPFLAFLSFKHKFSLPYPIMFWSNYLWKICLLQLANMPHLKSSRLLPNLREQDELLPTQQDELWKEERALDLNNWLWFLSLLNIVRNQSIKKKKKKLTERVKVLLSLLQLFLKLSYPFLCMNDEEKHK